MTHRSYYDVLGVAQTAEAADIRAAFVALAWKHHPDQNDGRNGAEKMQAINEAWHVIGDGARRRAYDSGLAAGGARPTGPRFERSDASSKEWVPFDTSEPLDMTFDRPLVGAKPLPRSLTLAPVVLSVSGVLMVGMGMIVRSGGVASLGVILLILAGASFLAVTLTAMSRAERDPNL